MDRRNRAASSAQRIALAVSALLAVGMFAPTSAWAAESSEPPIGGDSSEQLAGQTEAPTPPADEAQTPPPEVPASGEPGADDGTGAGSPHGGEGETPPNDGEHPAAPEGEPGATDAPLDPEAAPQKVSGAVHVGPASPNMTEVGVAAFSPTPPAAASDTALIAWVGAAEPVTKITLQAALNTVPDGGTVGITPGAYKFTSQLQVQRSTTITAASASTLYGRFLVNAGGLITANATLSPYANSQTVVTVANAAADVVLADLVITNSTSDGATPFTRTVGIGLGSSQRTQVLRPAISDVETAIALVGSTAARIENASVTGVTTGASITAANANAGPVFAGGSMTVTGNAIALGSTVAPSVSGMTLTGGGAGTSVHVNLATAATVTGATMSGFVNGVLLSVAHAGTGPALSNSSIGASLTGVDLGNSSGASLSAVVIERTGAGTAASNSTGVNLRRSTGVEVGDATEVSGFARGIHADDASTAVGPRISDSTITARVIGINLGATIAPSVIDTTVSGEGAAGITDGVRVLMAQGAEITRATVTGFTRGIYVDGDNTGAGPTIADSTIGIINTKAFGIALGSTTGATVTNVDVMGSDIVPQTGITVARAPGAIVTDARISHVTVGIGATRVTPELGLPLIEGPQIIRPVVTNSGSGVHLASSIGGLIEDAQLNVRGDGINGWETEDALITSPHIIGVPGPGPTDGTNSIRFYTSHGVTVTDAVLEGGASGLYWDMTYDVVIDNADVSGMEWYASYTESVTGYELRNSTVHDNAAIANLTINPSNQPFGNLRQVSSDIDWHDNTFTANPAGIYLPLGVIDFAFERNVVTGSDRFVILATPVHGFVVDDNDITFDPAAPTASAIGVTTFYEDLNEAGSYSSSDLAVTRNEFSGAGPFIRIGAVESVPDATPVSIELVAPEPPDAALPSEPSPEVPAPDPEVLSAPASVGSIVFLQIPADRRTVRTTMDVSSNTFPQNSIAIVTLPNAEAGEDSNSENEMIDGVVAVDAREETEPLQNDWGSECGPRVAATGYDGGGAFIEEVRTAQVLYPELCDDSPTPVDPTPVGPTPVGPTGAGGLAASGWATSPTAPILAVLMAAAGAGFLLASRRRRAGARDEAVDPAR